MAYNNWDETTMCVYLALSVFLDLDFRWVQKPKHDHRRSPELGRSDRWGMWHETLLIVHADWAFDARPHEKGHRSGRSHVWALTVGAVSLRATSMQRGLWLAGGARLREGRTSSTKSTRQSYNSALPMNFHTSIRSTQYGFRAEHNSAPFLG